MQYHVAAEVGVADLRVVQQLARLAGQRDPPGLLDVAVVSDL